MGDTQETAPPAAPSETQPPATPMIPKPRFDQALSRAKTLEEQLTAAKAEVEVLRGRLAQPVERVPAEPAATTLTERQPASPPPPQSDDQMAIMDLRLEHGYSRDAAVAVHGYMKKGLTREEADDYARKKVPAAFGGDRRGFDPTTHAMATPENTSPPPEQKKELNPSQKIAADRNKNVRLADELGRQRAREIIKSKIPGRTT